MVLVLVLVMIQVEGTNSSVLTRIFIYLLRSVDDHGSDESGTMVGSPGEDFGVGSVSDKNFDSYRFWQPFLPCIVIVTTLEACEPLATSLAQTSS